MAIQAPEAARDALLRDNQRLRDTGELLANKLMIASQRINLPGESGPYQDKTTRKGNQETEGQKLEKKGGYIDTGELDSGGKPLMIQGMPPAIDPDAWDPRAERRKQRIRDLKQGNQNPNEKKSAENKQSPRERIDIPDFLKTVIDSRPNPADQLKIILQLLPALTGGGLGQMAGPNYKKDTLKYGSSDSILNPNKDFKKPTLDMLIKHAANYPKA
jgi:hypothetical protein